GRGVQRRHACAYTKAKHGAGHALKVHSKVLCPHTRGSKGYHILRTEYRLPDRRDQAIDRIIVYCNRSAAAEYKLVLSPKRRTNAGDNALQPGWNFIP